MKSVKIILLTLFAGLIFVQTSSSQSDVSKYKFGELTVLADKYGTDKGSIGHLYTEVYEYFFYPVKYDATKICEIGIGEGASLKMFRDYFPKSTVYGIDILDKSELNSDRIKTYIADQANRSQLKSFIDANGCDFDIILDDGGHSMEQQQVSFGYLFKCVKPGGYYIIEDVHTSLGISGEEEKWTTLSMIYNFVKTGKIESKYMTKEEMDYLSENIRYCNLLVNRIIEDSITCICKKKYNMSEKELVNTLPRINDSIPQQPAEKKAKPMPASEKK